MTRTNPDYAELRSILDDAFEQSAYGKGSKRHANGRPWEQQPILEVSRITGIGFPAGQAMKKAGEAAQMAHRGELEAARAEFLGAIVYAAAAVKLCEEQMNDLERQSFAVVSEAINAE